MNRDALRILIKHIKDPTELEVAIMALAGTDDMSLSPGAIRTRRYRDKKLGVTQASQEASHTPSQGASQGASQPSPPGLSPLTLPPIQAPPPRETRAKGDPVDAKPPSKGSAQDWREAFAVQWREAKGGRFYGHTGDGKAIGALDELLRHMPASQRDDAWASHVTMIETFLRDDDPKVVKAGHPFAFFVPRFMALLVAKPTEAGLDDVAQRLRKKAEAARS